MPAEEAWERSLQLQPGNEAVEAKLKKAKSLVEHRMQSQQRLLYCGTTCRRTHPGIVLSESASGEPDEKYLLIVDRIPLPAWRDLLFEYFNLTKA